MRILILILCGILFSSVEAQEPSAPFGAIEDFFKAFHNKEAKVLSTAFSESAVMQRAVHQEEESVLIQQDISNFIKRVASRPDTPEWEEVLGTPVVQQSANLAIVWVPFRFYLDDFPLVTIPKKGKLVNPTMGKFSVQIEAKRHPNDS